MSRRNLQIDVLRFVFSVIIVLHHSRYVLGDENCLFLGGSLAVEFFFFVSGYLLLVSAQRAGETFRAGRPADAAGNGAAASPSRTDPELPSAASGIGAETWRFLVRKIRGFLPEFLIAWIIGFSVKGIAQSWSLRDAWTAFIDDFWELTLVRMSGLYTGGLDGVIWYLSAMLLGMAILYPLLRRHEDVMTHIVCPLLALFLYGYLCRTYGHPRDPGVWTGFAYKGLLRGIAGLSAGVTARMAVRRLQGRLRGRSLTGFGASMVTLAEVFLLAMTVRYMYLRTPAQTDYFYMFLLLLLVILCFSETGLENRLLRAHPWPGRLSAFLARYSLALYLSHIYFAQGMGGLLNGSIWSDGQLLTVYLVLAFGNAFVVMGLASAWRRHAAQIRTCVKSLFISG